MISNTDKLSARIDVTLDDMTAEPRYGCNRALEIYGAARLQTTERGSIESFARNIRGLTLQTCDWNTRNRICARR